MSGPSWRGLGALMAVGALVLTACSPDATPSYDPVPQTVDRAATPLDADQLRVPLQLEELPIVDPHWQMTPQYHDGMFLGADDADNLLTFRAVDTAGTVLWEAQRPQSCTGFSLTTTGEQSVALLSDVDDDAEAFGTTVTGYELATGDTLWGPVAVPGPHVGPGAVYAASPASQIGELGPKVVLDPATGAVLVDEQDDDVRIIGEYNGTVLLLFDEQLAAFTAQDLAADPDADPMWSLQTAAHDWDPDQLYAADAAATVTPHAALVGNSGDDLTLVDLQSGEVLGEGLRDAMQEPSSDMWVTLGDEIRGQDPTGTTMFQLPPRDVDILGAGGAMVFLRNNDQHLEARNVVTGEVAQAYDPDATGDIAVPIYVTPSGSGLLETSDGFVLAAADG